MILRLVGACCVLLGCGSFGYILSKNIKNEIHALQNFVVAIEYMECELKYRMTPLPELCLNVASVTKGIVSKVFRSLGEALRLQFSPNVSVCITSILKQYRFASTKIISLFEGLGMRMGRFDLEGQVQILESIREEASNMLKLCRQNDDIRTRSYKTIAVCAGAAIAILLI